MLPTESTSPSPRCIQEGDLVVVYESPSAIKAVTVEVKGQYSNRFGNFAHKDWVGVPFGSKVHCKGGNRGWVFLLAPTPELWTLVLRHRTQILYLADISMVVSHLDLRPGAVVLESGTGSGSLTHSLARGVAPTGHVHTFEFHPLRAQEAAEEFKAHGLQQLVTVTQRNIEEEGFPVEELAGAADAVFLDLPRPWRVVPTAAACLKPGGRFCAFSPCVEQVLRSVEALDAAGFTDITTLECLLREYEVVPQELGLLPPPQLMAAAHQQHQQQQQAASAAARDSTEATAAPSEQQPQQEEAAQDQEQWDDQEAPGAPPAKRMRLSTREPVVAASTVLTEVDDVLGALYQQLQQAGAEAAAGGGATTAPPASTDRQLEHQQRAAKRPQAAAAAGLPCCAAVVARPVMEARGHTGYLTFARKFVAP